METIIEREKFSIRMCSNGITELKLHDNVVIELDDARDQEKLLQQLMPSDGHLYLVISAPGTGITKEGREYANANPIKGKAMAIVAKSLPQKIVANFMITVYRKLRPNYPVKLFMKKENAENWLLNQF